MKKKTKALKCPKPLTYREVSKIAMVAGNEKKFSQCIHDGEVKDWVGIGWVGVRHAAPGDYLKIREVK